MQNSVYFTWHSLNGELNVFDVIALLNGQLDKEKGEIGKTFNLNRHYRTN